MTPVQHAAEGLLTREGRPTARRERHEAIVESSSDRFHTQRRQTGRSRWPWRQKRAYRLASAHRALKLNSSACLVRAENTAHPGRGRCAPDPETSRNTDAVGLDYLNILCGGRQPPDPDAL
jgi:hypothetical protein